MKKSEVCGNELDIIELNCGEGIMLSLKKIPQGEFLMGSENFFDAQPIHKVMISEPFYIGIYPVTQAQYMAVIGSNPSKFQGFKNPVDSVFWKDAMIFCKTLSQKIGMKVGLPSEAQWEYACRAEGETLYCFGNKEEQLKEYANYEDTPIYGKKSTSPIGIFKPNAWGLYDMHGNLWEWCEDIWHDNYEGAPVDGTAWTYGEPLGRIEHLYRGGSWGMYARGCHSSMRSRFASRCVAPYLGFRIVLKSIS